MAIELIIRVDDAGQISVTGPIDNPLIAYGLLEAGRDAIRAHHEQAAKRLVRPVGVVAMPQFGKHNGG